MPIGGEIPMTQAACYSNVVFPQERNINLTQEDFLHLESNKAFNNALQKSKIEIPTEFEKPGLAKEYKERHYYAKNHKNENVENPIWLDFVEHIFYIKIMIIFYQNIFYIIILILMNFY